MLFSALHTVADHHSSSDCQVCVANDHNNAISVFNEQPLNSDLFYTIIFVTISQNSYLFKNLLPYGHAPPSFLSHNLT